MQWFSVIGFNETHKYDIHLWLLELCCRHQRYQGEVPAEEDLRVRNITGLFSFHVTVMIKVH